MNHYITDTNKILLTYLDLSYATTKDGTVQYDAIHTTDFKQIAECTDAATAELIQLAQTYMPEYTTHFKSQRKLKDMLRTTAFNAAMAHNTCISLQSDSLAPSYQAYHYIYATSQGRYALAQKPLLYATDNRNPDIIRENEVRTKDLNSICYVPNYDLALFLLKYSEGRFHNADFCITPSHEPASYHHNRIQIHDIDGHPECCLRDGDQLVSIPEITTAKNNTTNSILRMYLNAAQYQLAVCQLFLALAKSSAAS